MRNYHLELLRDAGTLCCFLFCKVNPACMIFCDAALFIFAPGFLFKHLLLSHHWKAWGEARKIMRQAGMWFLPKEGVEGACQVDWRPFHNLTLDNQPLDSWALTCVKVAVSLALSLLSFLFGCTWSTWKFSSRGLNLSHSCNHSATAVAVPDPWPTALGQRWNLHLSSHMSHWDTARSLICYGTAGTPALSWAYHVFQGFFFFVCVGYQASLWDFELKCLVLKCLQKSISHSMKREISVDAQGIHWIA